jgi:CysZ protein
MKTVLRGFGYPFRALGVIGRGEGLWVFVLVPILINILVGALLYTWLFGAGTQWIDSQITGLPEWLQFAAWLLRGLLAIVLGTIRGDFWFAILWAAF